jgi:cardiolipin synthase
MKYKSFSLNSDFYKSLADDLSNAEKKIYLETYIYRDDEIGGKIKGILTEKASHGVTVKLLMDAVGSILVSEINFTKLILAGGDINFFRRMLLVPFHLTKLNNRNHRKLVLIDDNISYIGSTNINYETSSWREFNLRIDDSEVNELLSKMFIEQFVISNTLTVNRKKSTKIHRINGLTILRSVPFAKNPIRSSFLELIARAKKEIIIENPYVILDKKIYKSFQRAIKRGVKIKIILPKITDINLVGYLNRKLMRKVKKIGADIYFYPTMVHSKLILADDKEWMMGSTNLDYRSMFTQFEIMLSGNNREIKELIKKHLYGSIEKSEIYDEKNIKKIPLKEKVIGNLLYLVRFLF